MSTCVETSRSISDAWLGALIATYESDGHCVHLTMTASEPGEERVATRAALNEFLERDWKPSLNVQSVETVAGTIFPTDLYRLVPYSWDPNLGSRAVAKLDSAKDDLYRAYLSMLPLLRSIPANSRGTYFSRMISWPGTDEKGPNQIERSIQALRRRKAQGTRTNNLQDFDLSADCEHQVLEGGLQLTKADESRIFGFPCLVHISLTLFQGKLSMLAVYRHQYLVTKAYGNLLGLARLQHFLAQQSGFEVGELCVQATFADDERSGFTRGVVEHLIDVATAAVGAS